MILSFDRASETLTVIRFDNAEVLFKAANNVASNSRGPWPNGFYAFVKHVTHADDGPDSAYGSRGGLLFAVPGRTGMEVHSGRATVPDGLGRVGYQHCTEGCIRTTDEAMEYMLAAMAADALQGVMVE